MEILPFKQIGEQKWDAFCETSPDAWARHRSIGRRGALIFNADNIDCSFGVMQEGTLVAVSPLVTQFTADNEREFAFSRNMATPAPALAPGLQPAQYEAIFQACMEEVNRRGRELGVARSRMFIDPLTEPAYISEYNPLLAFGYSDASTTAYIVDLRRDGRELLARMKKGHRSDVVFAQKQEYAVDFFDHTNSTDDLWRTFIGLYDAAARRSVNSPERWADILDRVRQGFAFLALARLQAERTYLSGALIVAYKGGAAYSMAATHPSAKKVRGLGALIQWRTMEDLKRRGFERYDMGWYDGTQQPSITQKETSILNFKRHFGGDTVQLWAGIKKY